MHLDQIGEADGGPTAQKAMERTPHVPTRREHVLGISMILGVACLWVISAVFIQHIFDEEYDAPFFLTYYSVSLFSVYFVGFFLSSWRDSFANQTPYSPLPDLPDSAQLDTNSRPSSDTSPGRKALRLGALLAPLFFLSNWTFNVGLDHTSVASSSTIASLTGVFTIIFGIMAGVEKLSFLKGIAIALVVGGVTIISESDTRKHGGDGLTGDLISVLSTAIYALYNVVLKLKSGRDGEIPVMMMFAFMGMFTAIAAWPGFLVLNLKGWETFQAPSWRTFAMLTANGLVGTVLSDFLMAKGVILTTPLIGALSLSLSVPLSILADLIMGRQTFNWVYLIGAGLVFAGFIVVNVAEAVTWRNADSEKQPVTSDPTSEADWTELDEMAVR